MRKYEKEFWSATRILTKSMSMGESVRNLLFSRERKGVNFSLLYKLVIETIRRKNYLDALIGRTHKLSLKDRNILRVALFMEKFLRISPPKLPSYLDIIYKKAIKRNPLEEVDDEIQYYALKYYHPKWLVRVLLDVAGKDKTIKILEANNIEPRGKWIRVNTIRTKIEDFLERWQGLNSSEFSDIFFASKEILKGMLKSEDLVRGFFIVQDYASGAVVYALHPEEGEDILDACAAPGIKSFHIAALTYNKANIIATDISMRRIDKMLHLRRRLHANVEIILADSTKPPFRYEFDKILLDSPCSNTGVFREQPDLRWRLGWKQILMYTNIQKRLLGSMVNLTRRGGEIVYATCSILPHEGEGVIKWALDKYNNIELEKITLPKAERGYAIYDFNVNVIRYFPYMGVRGFFIAKIIVN